MNAGDYLEQVRRQLKGFLPEEREEILAELADHLAAGAEDESRVEDEAMRRSLVLAEMGSPDQMASSFQAVYRPNRWIDFLLIFVPVYLLYPAVDFLYLAIFNRGPAVLNDNLFVSFSLRAVLLLGLVMVFISVRRRSLLLFAFWAPDVTARLITLLTRQLKWLPGQSIAVERLASAEVLLYLVLLASILTWLGFVIWKNRANTLLVLFALQPLIGTLLGGFTTYYGLSHSLYPDYPNWRLWGIGMYNAVEVVSLAGFILLRPRSLRWLAFICGMTNSTVMMAAAYWPNPVLVPLWLAYTIFVLLAWGLERLRDGFPGRAARA